MVAYTCYGSAWKVEADQKFKVIFGYVATQVGGQNGTSETLPHPHMFKHPSLDTLPEYGKSNQDIERP